MPRLNCYGNWRDADEKERNSSSDPFLTKEEDPTGLLNEGYRYRDLATGVFITRDPAGFVDGPNVYTYVRQNPWTAFDPEGLEISAKTQTTNGRTETMFTIKGVIYDNGQTDRAVHASKDFPSLEIKKGQLLKTHAQASKDLYDTITKSITDAFTGTDGKHSWKVDLQLKVVKSAKEIKDSDHVVQLLSISDTKSLPGGGIAAGSASFGGTVVDISEAIMSNAMGAGHEFGHSAGLRHPYGAKTGDGVDASNPISSDTSKTPTSYAKEKGSFTSKQVQLMQFYATQNDLNGSHYSRKLEDNGLFTETWTNQNQNTLSIFGRKRFASGEFQGQSK